MSGKDAVQDMIEARQHADREDRTITVHVPLTIRKRSGRKLVIAPQGEPLPTVAAPRPPAVTPQVKAIARAFRWRELLENGTYTTIRELAAAEKINDSYVSRILKLTLMRPDLVQQELRNTRSTSAWGPSGS